MVWLWTARRGVFSHRTALALHGLSDILPAHTDLTMPSADVKRRLRVPPGVRLHHASVSEGERTWIGHVPVTSVLRTLHDCAELPILPDLLDQALDEAEARGLVPRSAIAQLRPQVQP